jgi:protein involved in polysaccharide export with SLBB domain
MTTHSFLAPSYRALAQRVALGLVLTLAFAATPVSAQQPAPPSTPAGPQSRSDLEQQAARLEQEAANAPSDADRTSKTAEAELIRTRLRDGDFRVGDRIVVSVDSGIAGVAAQPDSFTVRDGRMVEFPGLPPISLTGVLHSEISDYLTQQLSRYFRNPSVNAYPLLRIAVLGPVANPGFYSLPADVLLSDAIMMAGGPSTTARMEKTVVKRGEREVTDERTVQRALVYGYTLSQMNLRDGDAIHVGGANPRNWTNVLRAASIGLGLALSVYGISRQF